MRKIIVFDSMTLDGYFAGPNGELHEWVVPDLEVNKAAQKGARVDTALFGRVTFRMFENVWPKVSKEPKAPEGMKKMADSLTRMDKVVFSKSLERVSWENSRLLRGGVVEEAKRLKQGKGKDIIIFGSGTIVQQLMQAGLIDELVLVVNPVALGAGKPLFKTPVKLKLLSSKGFKSGNVLLKYEVVG